MLNKQLIQKWMSKYALLSTMQWTCSICFPSPNRLLSGDQNSSKEADSVFSGVQLWPRESQSVHSTFLGYSDRVKKRLYDLSHYNQDFCRKCRDKETLSFVLDRNEEAQGVAISYHGSQPSGISSRRQMKQTKRNSWQQSLSWSSCCLCIFFSYVNQ